MIVGIFGESCTGKSSIAKIISEQINAEIYTGKDYIRLAKNEIDAKKFFIELLKSNESTATNIIYVISEKEHLSLLPKNSIRILVTADLAIIKERFAKRMNSQLSKPVASMLEKRHGSFDNEKNDLHIDNSKGCPSDFCDKIINLINIK